MASLIQKRVLILYSDTGGGHRSAAEAIGEALEAQYGNLVHTEKVDFLRQYAPTPLDKAPEWYARAIKNPATYYQIYKLFDGQLRARAVSTGLWPYVRSHTLELLNAHPTDLIVSVHPFANDPILRVLSKRKHRPPFMTVVTDLVTMAAFWFDRDVDYCIVPTEAARKLAIQAGIDDGKIEIIGLPISLKFTENLEKAASIRQRFGWRVDQPLVLLHSGGEGFGPVEGILDELNRRLQPPASIVIICGRNQELKERLAARDWALPVHVYGFVTEVPAFMKAADIIISKAGPGTINEAFCIGLPIILYGRIPGQEDGNIDYVVSEGAGVWAPTAAQIADTVQAWLEHPEQRQRVAERSSSLAKPRAAQDIAKRIGQLLGL